MAYGKPFSIFLMGNLREKNGVLDIKLPYDEMRYNLWQFAIIDYSFECKVNQTNVLGKISTNFVTDTCFTENSEIVSYQPVICQILLKGNALSKQCIHLTPNWFYINSFNQKLQLFFKNIHTNELLSTDCNVYVSIIIQRIK